MGSCEWYAHVLLQYNDEELKAVMTVANNLEPSLNSSVIQQYKEVQIHGPLAFKEHFVELRVPRKYVGNKQVQKQLDDFTKAHGVPWSFMPESQPTGRPRNGPGKHVKLDLGKKTTISTLTGKGPAVRPSDAKPSPSTPAATPA